MFMIFLLLGILVFCLKLNPINLLLSRNQNIMMEPGKKNTFFCEDDSINGGDLLNKACVKKGRIYLVILRIQGFTFLFYSF